MCTSFSLVNFLCGSSVGRAVMFRGHNLPSFWACTPPGPHVGLWRGGLSAHLTPCSLQAGWISEKSEALGHLP